MDSINLADNPRDVLARQAKQRARLCGVVVGAWVLMMIVLIITLHCMKVRQDAMLAEVSTSLARVETQVKEQQKKQLINAQHKRAHCAARFLKSLVEHPIKGIQLKSLSYGKAWLLDGVAEDLHGFEKAKNTFGQYFVTNAWKEQQIMNQILFEMQGQLAC